MVLYSAGVVGMIEPGLPADKAHIKTGDVLVSVNGKPIHSVDDMLGALQEVKGNPVQLTILRDRKDLTLAIPSELVGSPDSTEKVSHRHKHGAGGKTSFPRSGANFL